MLETTALFSAFASCQIFLIILIIIFLNDFFFFFFTTQVQWTSLNVYVIIQSNTKWVKALFYNTYSYIC